MKKSWFTEEQIIGILKQHEAGMKTADLCREHGVSPADSFSGRFPCRLTERYQGRKHRIRGAPSDCIGIEP